MATSEPGSIVRNLEPVASCDSYAEAERAMDRLSDEHFPVEGALIVGVNLRLVEQVVGRLNYPRAAGLGAAAGLWFGLLIGLFFAIFAPGPAAFFVMVVWGLLWGVIGGGIFGLIAYALTRGRRDFISRSDLIADRYEVLVDSTHADRARELLERSR